MQNILSFCKSSVKIYASFFNEHYYFIHIWTVSIVAIILFGGNLFEMNNRFGDPSVYLCYAQAFWHGNAEIIKDPRTFAYCQRFISYLSAHPFHTLPREYPILSLIPFSIALLLTFGWYQLTFGLWMLVVIIGFYFYLAMNVSKKSSLLFIFLILIGGSRTAISRFDILPAIVTFFCLIAASKKNFFLAYILLAIAIFLKLYPILCFLPLCIAEQQSFTQKFPRIKRVFGIIVFGITCTLCIGLSFIINSNHGLNFFSYYSQRPFEFESTTANSIWLTSFFHIKSFCLQNAYGSVNMSEQMYGKRKICTGTPPLGFITKSSEIILPLIYLLGLLFIVKRQLEKKATLAQSFIVILLLTLITGKVFSPQYIIWLIPLIVYVRGYNRTWLTLWTFISLATTFLYPTAINTYTLTIKNSLSHSFSETIFFSLLTVRNGLLIILTIYTLFFLRKHDMGE